VLQIDSRSNFSKLQFLWGQTKNTTFSNIYDFALRLNRYFSGKKDLIDPAD